MNRFATPGTLAALVVANAALALALFTAASPAHEARAIGGNPTYVLTVGQGNGISQEIIYLVDADSGRAAAVSVNPVNKRIDLYGGRDIAKDLNSKLPTPK